MTKEIRYVEIRAMKKCFNFIFICVLLGIHAPVAASSELQVNSWSKSEYASINAVRSRADKLSESLISSCLGIHDKSENAMAKVWPSKDLKELKQEIDDRFDLDQDARLMYQMSGYDPDSYAAIVAKHVDANNLPFVRMVYDKYGVLGSKDIGLRSALDFLVLIIHADKDRRLQVAVLKSVNSLPSSDPDKSRFSGATIILKNRDSYKPKKDEAITVPYEKPDQSSPTSGPQCIKNVASRWYPWYVQYNLDKKLLEKARAHVGSADIP